jgi:adenine-specific DNA-methyltransferase
MIKKQKLELTWVGKENRPRLEPRILVEDPARSYHAAARVSDSDIFENVLIHGDNLLALKALEADYLGKVKCVYIDPPYNTGSAFKHYQDGVEHSIWLGLMRDRLEILRNLLSVDGALFVQADDNEGHYLKVICDEVFGRVNFISTFLWRKVDSPNDNKVPVTPDHEFIYGYAKEIKKVKLRPKADPELLNAYRGPDEDGRYYRDRLLKKNGKNSLRSDRPTMWFPVIAPDGQEVFPIHDDGREARWALGKASVDQMVTNSELIWKNRGEPGRPNWIPYTREYAKDAPTRPYNSLWTDLPTTRQTKAHQKEIFGTSNEFDTPKPEPLIERVLSMCTIAGDLVLDSFAGSGTTGAAAHKMGRRWIMVELESTCETHILPRLRKVINGEDEGGISTTFDWKGGGGFRFFNLAPSLLEKDKWDREVISSKYDASMLAQAICKLEGFTYAPSDSVYWQQGYSSESDFLYVTTQTFGPEELAALSEEVGEGRSLLILCAAFRGNPDLWPNLTLRKIPNHIRSKCEWGHDDYSLNVANLPMAEKAALPPPPAQSELFDGEDAA